MYPPATVPSHHNTITSLTMKTLLQHPSLRTSSMLFSDSYDEHLKIYRTFFSDSDIVLDIGCGPDGSDLQFDGIDIETDLSTIDFARYNTLNFSESIGYMSLYEILTLLNAVKPRKIIIKDFICVTAVSVPYFNYNFQLFYQQIIPILLRLGYAIQLQGFKPHKDRWKQLLVDCGLEYHEAPGIQPVLGIFTQK